MFHESTFDAGSGFGSGLFIEDFLPVFLVITFGYFVSISSIFSFEYPINRVEVLFA
jgi:hypothetical protein